MMTFEGFKSTLYEPNPELSVVTFGHNRDIDLIPLMALVSELNPRAWRAIAKKLDLNTRLIQKQIPIIKRFVNHLQGPSLWVRSQLPDQTIMNIMIPAIRSGIAPYPYISQYEPNPVSLLNNRSHAKLIILRIPCELSDGYHGQHIAILPDSRDYKSMDVITDHFTQDVRVKCHVRKFDSPYITYRKLAPRIVGKSIKIARERSSEFIGPSELSDAIYTLGIKACANFKVSLSVFIYNMFSAKVVYDPSSGWGDRAIGAALSDTVKYYIGTDPNTALKDGYARIKSFLKDKPCGITFHDQPAEDIDLDSVLDGYRPDFIFTSPPFFDYEIYSSESTQSVSRHNVNINWVEGWLIPTVLKNWSYLLPGGKLAYYIGNCGAPSIKFLIERMGEVPDAIFDGQIGLSKPGDSDSTFTHLFVWTKYSPNGPLLTEPSI